MGDSPKAGKPIDLFGPATVFRSGFSSVPPSPHPYLPSYIDFSIGARTARLDSPTPYQASLGMTALPPHPVGPGAPKQKPLKFINTTDGQPHVKRRRITAACKTCRKRKTRCSGERPVCETCSQNGHKCLGYAPSLGNQKGRPGIKDSESYDEFEDPEVEEEASQDDEPTFDPDERIASSIQSISRRPSRDSPGPSSPQSARLTEHVNMDYNISIQQSPSVSISPSPLPASDGHRVPYFRYFGPTAIVPGFKQMSVPIRDTRRRTEVPKRPATVDPPRSSLESRSSIVATPFGPPSHLDNPRAFTDIKLYDPNDLIPNSPLIGHLVETFFSHLGCNYPFLQRDTFLKDVHAKKIDTILVDAVCAISARFSNHPTLSRAHAGLQHVSGDETPKFWYGEPFAQRAKAAVLDTFACPSIAAVQACLLLAYDEFGSNHDSGLWMYLGISIRMAQDLGLQKAEGLMYEGLIGPTPKSIKGSKSPEVPHDDSSIKAGATHEPQAIRNTQYQRALERERINTFWAVFFLDRVISSSTGRPVTIRDKDIEVPFPSKDMLDSTGQPSPFPSLIRVIHLYGRVTDLLNSVKEVDHLTAETLKRLAGMEKDLTLIYQQISPQLHFNVANFQHYVKAEQGANFVLLHVWFHTLIVLLHQPTLLHSFEIASQQLFPNSRELSISSAKTIADILAFSELIDVKSFSGNPFTSQPIYIAACAFLQEGTLHATPTRRSSDITSSWQIPKDSTQLYSQSSSRKQKSTRRSSLKGFEQDASRRALLAAAASQNYQRCFKALKTLESYWAGTKYILTALAQKSKYNSEPSIQSPSRLGKEAGLLSPEQAFKIPGWQKRPFSAAAPSGEARLPTHGFDAPHAESYPSQQADPSQAFAWSLTGTTDSSNSNLTFLFPTANQPTRYEQIPGPSVIERQNPSLPLSSSITTSTAQNPDNMMTDPNFALGGGFTYATISPPVGASSSSRPTLESRSQSPYNPSSLQSAASSISFEPTQTLATAPDAGHTYSYSNPQQQQQIYDTSQLQYSAESGHLLNPGGNMMIQSADVDMNALGNDMMPWLDSYLPQDVLGLYDSNLVDETGQEATQNDSLAGPADNSESRPPQ